MLPLEEISADALANTADARSPALPKDSAKGLHLCGVSVVMQDIVSQSAFLLDANVSA